MRGEDCRVLFVRLLLEPALQRRQIKQRAVDRRVELAPLQVLVGREFGDDDVLVMQLHHLPHAQPGGGGHTEQQVGITRSGRLGDPLGLGIDRRHSCGVGPAQRQRRAIFAQAAGDSLDNRVQRGLGVWTVRRDDDLVATRDGHRHDRHDRLRVGRVVASPKRDVGVELLGQCHQSRRRPGVQAGRVGDQDSLGAERAPADDRAGFGGRLVEHDLGHHVLSGGDHAGHRGEAADRIGVGDDHLGQQAQGLLGDRVQIEGDQLVTDADLLASLDLGLESLAAHPDGVEADVQQDLQSVCGADGHRVLGRLDVDDFSVDRREEYAAERVDGNAVTHHLLGEDRVGNHFDGYQDAGERRDELNSSGGQCLCHEALPSVGEGAFEQPKAYY